MQAWIMDQAVISLAFCSNLALNVTVNCICEIQCLALVGLDLNIVHKLSGKEKESRQSRDSNLGLLGGNLSLVQL